MKKRTPTETVIDEAHQARHRNERKRRLPPPAAELYDITMVKPTSGGYLYYTSTIFGLKLTYYSVGMDRERFEDECETLISIILRT